MNSFNFITVFRGRVLFCSIFMFSAPQTRSYKTGGIPCYTSWEYIHSRVITILDLLDKHIQPILLFSVSQFNTNNNISMTNYLKWLVVFSTLTKVSTY